MLRRGIWFKFRLTKARTPLDMSEGALSALVGISRAILAYFIYKFLRD